MDNGVVNFLRARRIDSFQKLRFLLFLHRYPDMKGTCQEFAARLHLGDLALVEKIMADLHHARLLERIGQHCRLLNEPGLKASLHFLARAFENPLTRQELLDQVKPGDLRSIQKY
ncbi:MAG: hypothetical protein DPW09_45910 [Anaerolineae bacterium]|nr:hypothetical protein [Anaerolineae bacterium]